VRADFHFPPGSPGSAADLVAANGGGAGPGTDNGPAAGDSTAQLTVVSTTTDAMGHGFTMTGSASASIVDAVDPAPPNSAVGSYSISAISASIIQ